MVKILVFGGWFGSRNIGDDAILIGIKNIFKKILPNVNITVPSSDPEYTKRICGVNATNDIREILQAYTQSNLIIISGGTPIYDYDYFIRIGQHFILPKILRKRVVYFGISSKKIKKEFGKILTKIMLNGAEYISVREPETIRILTEMGIRRNLVLTGDSALMMEPELKAHVRKILSEKVVLKDAPTIGICPRYLSNSYKKHFHDEVGEDGIKNINLMIAKTAEYLIKKDYNVIFIPFHTVPYDNDMMIIKNITALMNTSDFQILDGKYAPSEIMGIIGEMDLVIGMRFHSLIFAAAQNVPIVTINYDTKVKGLIELLGMDEFMCTPIDKPSVLINKIEEIFNNKRKIKKILELQVENIKKRILSNAKEIMKFVE
jgi:polysaccharide pyruvyl transferase WcaK-like protein